MADIALSETKAKIAKIIGINSDPGTEAWDIKDSIPEEHLYLIHYNEDANLNKYGDLRGIVVDTKAGTIVCRSFGFTPSVTASSLVIGADSKYHLIDVYGHKHDIDSGKIKIKLGFEGTIMRVFKHNGNVYMSTHRRLRTGKSRWGNSIPFTQMYEKLGGPQPEKLFDPNKKYSPYCHIFLMVHPDVLNVTKADVGNGYLVYLGPKQVWSNAYPESETDLNLTVPDSSARVPSPAETPMTITPLDLTLDQANRHLRYGWTAFDDSRLDIRSRTGEFIILYVMDDDDQINRLIRVQSPAYEWRLGVRDNDPNLLHRFYALLNPSYIQTNTARGLEEYVAKFPIVQQMSKDRLSQLVNERPVLFIPLAPSVWMRDKNDNLYNIWLNFVVSIPINKQKEALEYYTRLVDDRDLLISWLESITDEYDDMSDLEISPRAKRIISDSRGFASKQPLTKVSVVKRTQGESGSEDYESKVKSSIRFFVMREEGTSLYRLVKNMKDYKAGKLKKKKEDGKEEEGEKEEGGKETPVRKR